MIKVNLGSRKQSKMAASGDSGGGGPFGFLRSRILRPGEVLEGIKQLPLRKPVLVAIVAALAFYLEHGFEQDLSTEVAKQSAAADAEQTKLQGELNKTKGFEDLKKSLDEDALLLHAKLDTINKLIAERQTPPKILMALASVIPPNAWISQFKLSSETVEIKGSAANFDGVSDFMKGMGESSYFKEFKLVSSEQSRDDSGMDVANFELSGKRRF